ncbi:MAG: phosphoglycerate mutase family protein [Patescibacteria group bacterium]
MRVFLVRHGSDDFCEGEYSIGRKQAQRAANFLKQQKFNADKTVILSSKLPRAINTAEIIREILGTSEVKSVDWLSDKGWPRRNIFEDLNKFIAANSHLEVVILVSHAPQIAKVLTECDFLDIESILNCSIFAADLVGRKAEHLFTP